MAHPQEDPRQSAFSGGEVAPALYGRTDLKKYEHSLKRCKNGIVNQQGSWMNRPGTTFVAEVADSTQVARLIPFLFANGQNYVLEFGNLTLRVYQGGTFKFALATPYLSSEVARLKFAQSGDVVTLVHPNHYPQNLSRLVADGSNWSLVPLSFARAACMIDQLGLGPLKFAAAPVINQAGDATHPLKGWQWSVTSSGGSANAPETLPTALLSPPGSGKIALYPDMPADITTTFASSSPDAVVYSVYRGRNGVRGLVGAYVGTVGGFTFHDDGDTPDFSIQPPLGTDPFAGFAAGQFPTNVTYYQQRLIFTAGGKIWASATGDYYRFDEYAAANADGAFSFNIASQNYEEVRSFLPMRVLLALTNAKDWAISGAFAKTTLNAVPNNVRGAAWLDPLTVGAAALYVQDGLASIYELSYNFSESTYLGNDVTLSAQHLFFTHTIKEWAYAQNPFSIVWAVRDDGRLLGMTYTREQELAAWHWHDTQGLFESVCAVPEGAETAVYVIVNRTVGGVTKRYIERFASRNVPRIPDGTAQGTIDTTKGIFLDCAKTFAGQTNGIFGSSDPMNAGNMLHLNGASVMILADGNVLGPYTIVNGQVDFSSDAPDGSLYTICGLSYVPEGESLNILERSKVRTVYRVQFEVVESRGLWWGMDFDHLREWRQRQVKDSYGSVAPFSGTDHVRIPGGYQHEASVVWRVVDPLPVTITGITRETDFGGD